MDASKYTLMAPFSDLMLQATSGLSYVNNVPSFVAEIFSERHSALVPGSQVHLFLEKYELFDALGQISSSCELNLFTLDSPATVKFSIKKVNG